MFRTLIGLLGLAVIGAVFAGVYYADDVETVEDRRPAFALQPGEVRADFLEPSVPGGIISVDITVRGPPIDIWLMDQEWLGSTIIEGGGGFDLSQPFSYHAAWTTLNVSGQHTFTYIADGETRIAMALDHSDAYYNDTAPAADAGPALVEIRTRYVEEEAKSLLFGYIAAVPSVLLIGVTLGRQIRRRRAEP